jgi:hypothetical protein
MADRNDHWRNQPQLWIELFVLLNISFLSFDIYLAHSVNQFRNPAEYIPLFFSAVAPLMLILALRVRSPQPILWNILGQIVGWAAVVVGCWGVILHLQSHFFYERTLRSLTYSAPFAAPLAYAGLGFLLIMNRMVNASSIEWAQWILAFSLGGFFGNFIFSLADHATNGFYYRLEWVPVAASALAVGLLTVALVARVSNRFLMISLTVLGAEIPVGIWGFVLHATANLRGPSVHAFANFIYGSPPLAPLLFPNLAVLAFIGIWKLRATRDANA